MAQYQKNFYSSSLYGRLKAFYGEYQTQVFDSQEPFSSKIDAKIEAILPASFYGATSPEFKPLDATQWTTSGTSKKTSIAGSVLEFNATGDNVEVHVLLQSGGNQNIEAKLYREEYDGTNYSWVEKETKTFNTLSVTKPGTTGVIAFTPFGFADYKVSIKVVDRVGTVTVLGAKLRTSEFSLELSTSSNNSQWSVWEKVSLTLQSVAADSYLVTGQTITSFTNIRYVKGKFTLLSSDNRTSPIVDRIELRSENSGLYEPNGNFLATIDMTKVASNVSVGTTFKQVDNIRWNQSAPAAGTEITVRSSSSPDKTFWGPVTAPYRPNTKRIRLKRNIGTHSLTIGPINEENGFSHVDITSMLQWNAEAFSPKDPSNTNISLIFSKTKTNILNPENKLQHITDAIKETNRFITFAPQPYFLTVKIVRDLGRGTPVVDMVSVDQKMAYRQKVNITDKDVSAVDSLGTGIKRLQAIKDYAFTYPSITGRIPYNQTQIQQAPQRYTLEDKTARPSDVMLYLKSEEKDGLRKNDATLDTDEVMAKAIHRKLENGDTTGVKVHYLYGAGEVQYLRPYEREVSSGFTPALDEAKKYRYYVFNGWPSDVHKVISGQELSEIASIYKVQEQQITALNPDIVTNEDGTLVAGQFLTIPNNYKNAKVSLLFKNGTAYTMKSSHNALFDKGKGIAVTDLSSEKIVVTVPQKPPSGYIPWLSEEKIYTGVINANDVRDGFLVTQYNRSSNSGFNRDYKVVIGDTWVTIANKYDVNVNVLKAVNVSEELKVGETILIPPNIILPALAPEAEFEGNNPYTITIVPDSVQKKDGTRIDESFIQVDGNTKRPSMVINYAEPAVFTAEMVRGNVLNGMDPLPLSDVVEILSVKKKTGAITYHAWNDTTNTGDFKLESNYIDWSPTGVGILEPAAGDAYVVTFTRREIDNVEIYLDTTFYEKMGTDIVWRSREVKVFDGMCTPTQDFEQVLPSPDQFEGFSAKYKNVDYVIEDNDLWVESKLVDKEGQKFLVGTLNGKDPSKNWHPTINTGHYYLKEQEHYLYSEPLKTVLDEKVLPTAENIEYTNGVSGIGALLMPSGENLVRDSTLKTSVYKKSLSFNSSSI